MLAWLEFSRSHFGIYHSQNGIETSARFAFGRALLQDAAAGAGRAIRQAGQELLRERDRPARRRWVRSGASGAPSLETAGLVTVTRIGNQKHYQANREAPIYEELRGIVLKTVGLADVLRKALAPLAPHIHAAFVYGSVAKGTDTARSDIDLMVVADEVEYGDVFKVASGAEAILGRKINPTVLTSRELKKESAQDGFHSRVLAQPKIFVIGSGHELGKLGQARAGRTAEA